MQKLLCFMSIISFLFGCSPKGPKQPVTNLEKDYALADSLQFDHFVIDNLRKLKLGDFRRSMANLEDQDIKIADAPPTLKAGALEFEYAGKEAKDLVFSLKDKFREEGYLIFVSQANFGHSPDKITVLKSIDQFDILRFMATNGINYDIDTDSVIAKLRQWNDKYDFEIVGADLDWVDAHFTGSNYPDFAVFAKEVYAFCPDVVDQGTGTVEALEEEMDDRKSVYLWWD